MQNRHFVKIHGVSGRERPGWRDFDPTVSGGRSGSTHQQKRGVLALTRTVERKKTPGSPFCQACQRRVAGGRPNARARVRHPFALKRELNSFESPSANGQGRRVGGAAPQQSLSWAGQR